MKNHVRVYLKFWGYAVSSLSQEKIPCDYCQKLNTEVHHISKRGSGGRKKKDTPENLVALCRTCHTMADHNKEFNDMVKKKLDEKIMRKIYG
jgi:5-methylcytosine-specific restriction endonuclease McrA